MFRDGAARTLLLDELVEMPVLTQAKLLRVLEQPYGIADVGLLVGNTIRCPWHHARFNIHTGKAEGAPALNPLSGPSARL